MTWGDLLGPAPTFKSAKFVDPATETPLVSRICNYSIWLRSSVIVQLRHATLEGPANETKQFPSQQRQAALYLIPHCKCEILLQEGRTCCQLPQKVQEKESRTTEIISLLVFCWIQVSTKKAESRITPFLLIVSCHSTLNFSLLTPAASQQ